ncbi:hypothetical protein FXO37_22947 [Capsicum annuum]|nr:hypothetical protein FXO37_22947 [Capsicum annuum]
MFCFLHGIDLSVPVLIQTIRRLTKEKVELDSRTRRLETEKNELQSVLEKKLDRRSSDWSLKLEKYQIEQHRLRERARDLAKQNVSQQREVFSFNEKEVDNRINMSFLEKHLEDLSNRIEQVSEENQNLRQQLTQLQEEYRVAQDNIDYIRENYQEKGEALFEEMDIKQLQSDLDATVRGNDILKCEVRNVLDALSCATPKLKYLELQLFIQSDWNLGSCLYGFKLLKSRVIVLFVAGTSRVFLICFGVHYWYFGHCISYAVVASVLLGAAVLRHLSVTDPLAARRDALQSTVIRLREGFHRKDQNSSASSSEGCGSSVKRSSSADVGHLGNAIVPCTGDGSTWNNIEVTLKAKVILVHPVVQQILDLNLALAFQEKLSYPRITSMLKRKGRHTDRELAILLQDKGLDPNFAVMLKENGLDPMILALLQRSSLDADREHHDSNPPVTDSNDVEDVLPNHISFLEELRLQGLGKWLQRCRVMLHHVVGTPERAWLLFSLIFILETVVMAIFRPKTIKILNATHQQFEFGIAVLLLSPVVCSILAFLRSLQAEDLSMTSKPRKVKLCHFISYLPGNLVFKCIIVSIQELQPLRHTRVGGFPAESMVDSISPMEYQTCTEAQFKGPDPL